MVPKKNITQKNYFSFILISFSFLFISSFCLNLEGRRNYPQTQNHGIKENLSNTLGASDINLVLGEIKYPVRINGNEINLFSKSVLAIDIESGLVLYEKDSQNQVMPASTAKIITALVALDAFDLDQNIVIPEISVDGQKINLVAGGTISVRDLLYALLVSSANDAAEVLAYHYPGGRDLFIAQMNLKAQSLGLNNSLFVNPTGLDEIGQSTTAQDMVKVSFYAMQNPVFAQIVNTKRYDILNTNGEIAYRLQNINQLLGTVEGVKGVKTGKTDGAMENLITYVNRGSSKILLAVLGSSDRFGDTKNLINWIYNSYTWKE